MTIQSLTYQWQEAAIRGYDPNRHGLENPETERAKDIRDRLHNKERFEQNFGEYARKSRDGALDFERADHMAATYKYSAETMALYSEIKRDYEGFSERYSDDYVRQMQAEAKANELEKKAEYDQLLHDGIILQSGKTVWYDKEQNLFFDEEGYQATEAEDQEARAPLESAEAVWYEAKENSNYIDSWAARRNDLKIRWQEIENLEGKVSDEEYQKLLKDFQRDFEKLKADAPHATYATELDNTYGDKSDVNNDHDANADGGQKPMSDKSPEAGLEQQVSTHNLDKSMFAASGMSPNQGIQADGIDPTASFNYAAVPPPPPPSEQPSPETKLGISATLKPGGYT